MTKNIKPIFVTIFVMSIVLSFCLSQAHAQTPQEILNQYIFDLQKNPNDNALREKIIKHVQMMKPTPVIPEEARRNYVMAKTLFKDARNIQDYNDALAKFKAALLLAPWWVEAYLDMGMAYEAAQQYAEAINELKLYVVANPDSEKSRKAQDEIYIIEAKTEKAAKESSPEAVAAKKQNEYEAWLKKINGTRFVWHYDTGWGPGYQTIDIQGNKLILGNCLTRCVKEWCPMTAEQWYSLDETTLNGTEFIFPKDCWANGPHIKGKISDDGYSITLKMCNNTSGTFLRER